MKHHMVWLKEWNTNITFLNAVCRLSLSQRGAVILLSMMGVRAFVREQIHCLLSFFYDIYFLIYLYQHIFVFLSCHYLSCNIFVVKSFPLELIVSINLVEYMLRKYYSKQPCYLLCSSLIIVISCELISTEMYFLTKCSVAVCLLKLKLNKLL